MLEKALQGGVGEALLVVEVHVLEHAAKLVVRVFDGVEGGVQMLADVGGVFPNVLPEMPGRDVETVFFRIGGKLGIAVLREALLVLLLPHVAEAFEEEQAENIVLVVGRIDGAAKDISRFPEVALQLAEGKNCHGMLVFKSASAGRT
jgi:hypothetical protein